MSENSNAGRAQSWPDELFARLPQKDVEEFYAGYLEWALNRHTKALQDAIALLQQQIDVNSERMHAAQPSAVALATLARLQANGVSDIELLDRMLEHGEEWLDATMQRLEYCEQLDDFLIDDFDQWCRHALDGAYDWIDSMRRQGEETEADQIPSSAPSETPGETFSEATEELMLSKLSSDKVEDDVSLLEITLKRPAMIPVELQEAAYEQVILPSGTEQILHEPGETVAFEEPGAEDSFVPVSMEFEEPGAEDSFVPVSREHEQPATQEYIAPEVTPSEEESSTLTDEQPVLQEFAPSEESFPIESMDASSEEPPLQEFAPTEEILPAEDRDAGNEEPALQEFTAPTLPIADAKEDTTVTGYPLIAEEDVNQVASFQNSGYTGAIITEEPPFTGKDAQDHITSDEVPTLVEIVSVSSAGNEAEETVVYEASNEHGDTVSTANAVGTGEPAATGPNPPLQWEWVMPPDTNSSENQEDQPKRRSNFLWRLLAKIWGR